MKRLLAALLFLLSSGCALLPDPGDLEAVLPDTSAYEAGIAVPEFVQ